MARTGKIARLPFTVRNLLNEKLRDGEQGTKLVAWLNGLPTVLKVLAAEFEGRPINEQNLTEWRQGGYEDWLRHQETWRWVSELAEQAAQLEEEAGDFSVADWLSAPLGVELGHRLQALATRAADDPVQNREFIELCREIGRLRRDDHDEQRLKILREQWEAVTERNTAEKHPDSPILRIYDQLHARRAADFLKKDVEEHGGYVPPETETFLAAMGRTPVRPNDPVPSECEEAQSK